MEKILIADDDPDIGLLLKRFLERNDFNVSVSETGLEALKAVTADKPDLVLLDFRLPDFDGEEVLKKIKEKHQDVQVIIITGYGDVKTAIKTIKRGAFDYVTKPIQPEEILMRIKEALKNKSSNNNDVTSAQKVKSASKTNTQKEPKKQAKSGSDRKTIYVVGDSPQAQQVTKHIDLVAPTDMSVIITGETGSGKEYAARRIHFKSNRSNNPFVAVDCGALPENLSGSSLFGHEKGAFTGALQKKLGSFERAHTGTLFLDEVGNLSYDNQVKLLRVLEERKVTRLGSEKPVDVDVRVLVATNEDLSKSVEKGEFREDLYHRLNEFKIEIPPLRKRQEDLESFLNLFIEKANNDLEKSIKGVSAKALDQLKKYPWHGNLRELKNTVKRAVLLENEDRITLNSLPDEMWNQEWENDNEDQSPVTLKEAVAVAERKAIVRAIKRVNGNKSEAAKILGVDRKTLYNKMSQLDLTL
ncbi:sigma-54-dependent transcriptional regulator [Salibacter halophilus]|uniref:Sigma-54-dependent Fis family transcriptional regulator n=1 Tax=Salibacter halophilus TaxID=1803916 RepID=A0A6N6M7N4_9FLAO|nr:sigma-54 dependent transcriptional regulator [Salibacter halophilus]KAB1064522.1 sigma-54-dependent Fis family transcriptional regulator [Salibacter halophilus]